jgi:crossover junction endodeoxyribonuclease RuvC
MGIDFGVRRVAVATNDGEMVDEALFRTVPPGVENDVDAMDLIYRYVHDRVYYVRPQLVAIESPIQGHSANIKTGLRLAAVTGVLAVACRHAGSSTVSVAPAEWKKAVTGHGDADKEQVSKWLSDNRPDLFAACDSQDLVDATCMALYAQALLDR